MRWNTNLFPLRLGRNPWESRQHSLFRMMIQFLFTFVVVFLQLFLGNGNCVVEQIRGVRLTVLTEFTQFCYSPYFDSIKFIAFVIGGLNKGIVVVPENINILPDL